MWPSSSPVLEREKIRAVDKPGDGLLARMAVEELHERANFGGFFIDGDETWRYVKADQRADSIGDELRPDLICLPIKRLFEQVCVTGNEKTFGCVVRANQHPLGFGADRKIGEVLTERPTPDQYGLARPLPLHGAPHRLHGRLFKALLFTLQSAP